MKSFKFLVVGLNFAICLSAVAIALAGVLSLGANKARAQSLSLGISPPVLEVIIKPGKTITQTFKLVNNGETVIITARLVEMGDDGIVDNPDFQPEPWISLLNTDVFFNKPFLFEAKAEKQLILKIAPPKSFNTAQGKGSEGQEIYRVLLFTTTVLPPGETTQSSVAGSIGSILLISVTQSGMVARGAQITKFDLPPLIDSLEPLRVDISVKNTGKTYFRPLGKILLKGPLGQASYDIRPNVLLAGQTRTITTSASGDSDLSLILPGFYIGKYQLTIGFTLDEGNIKIEQTKTFYAVPWKIAGGLVLLSGIIIAVGKKRKKRDTNK